MEKQKLHESKRTETRLFLIDLMNRSAENFLFKNIFLGRLERNELTLEEWRKFATARLLSTQPFERFLEATADAAKRMDAQELHEVISENLCDERGIDQYGNLHEDRAHSTWRKNFYKAIGIHEENFKITSEPAASAYVQTLEAMIARGDAMELAGAVLALEAIIPREFLKIKIGRDKKFPNLPKDARTYIDDHITHDAQQHYPDLLSAVEPLLVSEDLKQKVKQGIEIVVQAKKSFYQQLFGFLDDSKQ